MLQVQRAPSLGERIFNVIRADIAEGSLPAGALLPTAERVAQDLAVDATDVRAAYARLLAEGEIGTRPDGQLFIQSMQGDPDPNVGDETQLRFEDALMRAMREAAARGLSASEATGLFKAAVLRMRQMERQPPDGDDD